MGRHHRDGGQHRPRARDEEHAESEAEDEPSGVAVGLSLCDAGERPFEEMAQGRDDEPGRHDAEDDEAGVPQEILGQPDRAQEGRSDQGCDAEAHDQPRHDRVGAVAAGRRCRQQPTARRLLRAHGDPQGVARSTGTGRLSGPGGFPRLYGVFLRRFIDGRDRGAGHEDHGEDGEDAR